MDTKLNLARNYWNQLSSGLNVLSDESLKTAIEAKIAVRDKIQGAKKYRRKVLELIRKCGVKHVLDFGCGVGGDGVWFSQKMGVAVTFADVAKDNVLLVSRHSRIWGINTKAVFMDNPATFIFPETYDMVFSDGVLHHIPNAEEVVCNLSRFLKPKGLFVCMLYTFKHYLESRGFLGYASRSESNPENPYSRFYTRKQANKLFNGFTLVDYWKTFNGKFGWYAFQK